LQFLTTASRAKNHSVHWYMTIRCMFQNHTYQHRLYGVHVYNC